MNKHNTFEKFINYNANGGKSNKSYSMDLVYSMSIDEYTPPFIIHDELARGVRQIPYAKNTKEYEAIKTAVNEIEAILEENGGEDGINKSMKKIEHKFNKFAEDYETIVKGKEITTNITGTKIGNESDCSVFKKKFDKHGVLLKQLINSYIEHEKLG